MGLAQDSPEEYLFPGGEKYIRITSREQLKSIDVSSEYVVLDIETDSLRIYDKETDVIGIGICFQEGLAYYIDLQADVTLDDFSAWAESNLADKKIIGHNIKFDYGALLCRGVPLPPPYWDTSIANYCLLGSRYRIEGELLGRDANGPGGHSLDDCALFYLNIVKKRTKDLIPKRSKENKNPSLKDCNPSEVAKYCCEDVDVTLRLFHILDKKLSGPSRRVYDDIERPLVEVLSHMELDGVYISREKFDEFSSMIYKMLNESVGYLQDLAGEEIKITDKRKIASLVYDKLKIHEELGVKPKKNKDGSFSIAAAERKKMEGHPVIEAIEKCFVLDKLRATYVDGMLSHIGEDGIIHPTFNQSITSTGRLSSSNPNVQNLPASTEIGKMFRSLFCSRFEGGKILAADWSQCEVRILAHMSREPLFIEAFTEDRDIHLEAARVLFNIPSSQDVDPFLRKKAKTLNFGLIYGMGPPRLADSLQIEIQEANDLLRKYLGKFKNVAEWQKKQRRFLKKNGYVETLFGRRRYLPGVYSSVPKIVESAYRKGCNMPIQGTNADIMKLCMIKIFNLIRDGGYKSKLVLQVHDEIVVDLYPGEEDLADKIKNIMESIVDLVVPLVADVRVADNWAEAH